MHGSKSTKNYTNMLFWDMNDTPLFNFNLHMKKLFAQQLNTYETNSKKELQFADVTHSSVK